MRTPSKFFCMMKLTTPATASAPYTAEAPPVSTSTRCTRAEGMKFTSEPRPDGVEAGSPGTRRRPSISTRGRATPRPRRFRVAVPVAPLEIVPPWAAMAWGRLLTVSYTHLRAHETPEHLVCRLLLE